MTAIDLSGIKHGGYGVKTKYDARHQLKQAGWSDEELDAIGLTGQDEGKVTVPARPWLELKPRFELADVIDDGTSNTFIYRDTSNDLHKEDDRLGWNIFKRCSKP